MHRLPAGAMALLAFVLPLAHTPGLRNLLAGGIALSMLILALRCRLAPLPSPWIAAWAGLCLLSALWSIAPANTLKEVFWSTLVPLGCALAAMRWVDRERAAIWLAWPLLLGMGFILLVRLLYLAAEPAAPTWIESLHAFWPGRGVASTLAVLIVPLGAWLMTEERRRLGVALLAVAFVVGSQTWNRMFWIAALVALLPWLLLHGLPRLARVGAALAALAAVVAGFGYAMTFQPATGTGMAGMEQNLQSDPRWRIWPEWGRLAMERPVLGHGAGHRVMQQAGREKLPRWLYDYQPHSFSHGHNVLLDTFVQLGIVGLVVFLILLGDLLRRFRHCLAGLGPQRAAALAGIGLISGMLAKNMTDDFMNHAPPILFWLLLGSFIRLARMGQSDSVEARDA